jgi:hypothetical protein
MADPKKPQEKIEEKKLTEGQKFRLLNVHLNDKLIQLERELAATIQQVGELKAANVDLRSKLHEASTDVFFKELGIARGEQLQLSDDGTLLIKRQVQQKAVKPKKEDETEKLPGNGTPEPVAAGTGEVA